MTLAKVTRDEEYDRLEHNSIEVMNQLLEAAAGGQPIKKTLMAAAKTAQQGLGHVQSHRKTRLGARALDFSMARSLTTDPAQLAEYVRQTQPDSGIVRVLPAKSGD